MRKLNPKALTRLPLKVEFETGEAVRTFKDVLELKKGSTLKLDNAKESGIMMKINGMLIAYGKVLEKDGLLFAEITKKLKNKGGRA